MMDWQAYDVDMCFMNLVLLNGYKEVRAAPSVVSEWILLEYSYKKYFKIC
eukprot:m.18052 g.18052  ORF g.18052 m.18052 type:complete len:50 (-) comp6179_c0_seq1:66-215(-)